MIPSDHFVYFYNEVFKYLQRQGPKELDRYYQRVADRQGNFTLDEYRRKGLKGVYDYYCRIRREENCDMDLELTSDHLLLRMKRCPSLMKALESDAGACQVYCDHCPGWCLRVLTEAGFWEVYDMVSRTEPVCDEWIYTDRACCRKKYEELVAKRGPDLVRTNLDMNPPFLTGKVSDSARFGFFHPNIEKAFRFLRETDLAAMPIGRTTVDGDSVFANVTEVEFSSFRLHGEVEVHRRYADIHVPICGRETFGVHTASEAELDFPYDSKTDCLFFKGRVEPLTLEPGEFVLFFPLFGAHQACCTMEKSPAKCRRVTMKVKIGDCS